MDPRRRTCAQDLAVHEKAESLAIISLQAQGLLQLGQNLCFIYKREKAEVGSGSHACIYECRDLLGKAAPLLAAFDCSV